MNRFVHVITLIGLLASSAAAHAERPSAPAVAGSVAGSNAPVVEIPVETKPADVIYLPAGASRVPTRHLKRYLCASGGAMICLPTSRVSATTRCTC
jgi:hypothetical protein